MRLMQWIILALLAVSLAVSVLALDALPGRVASHWNAEGQVDGYMEKGAGTLLMPVLAVVLVGVFYALPYIDPLRKNILEFREYYEGFILVFVAFFTYLNFITIAWNLGYSFNMGAMLVPAVGVLFIYIGFLCGKSRQNWFIGIRSPWTLSSERVWEKTHFLAKKVFIAVGVLWILLGVLFPKMILVPVAIVLLASVGLFAYSYFAYRKEEERIAAAARKAKGSGGGKSPGKGGNEGGSGTPSGKVFPFAGQVPSQRVLTEKGPGARALAPVRAARAGAATPPKPAKTAKKRPRGGKRAKGRAKTGGGGKKGKPGKRKVQKKPRKKKR